MAKHTWRYGGIVIYKMLHKNALDGAKDNLIYEDTDCIDNCTNIENELDTMYMNNTDEDILKSTFKVSDDNSEFKGFWVNELFYSIL